MKIITWGDIRRGTLAIVLVIIPTVLLGNYIGVALQSYQITGPGLWQLKQKNVPDEVIEPLHALRLKPFFFKFRLMSEVESRIETWNYSINTKIKLNLNFNRFPCLLWNIFFLPP